MTMTAVAKSTDYYPQGQPSRQHSEQGSSHAVSMVSSFCCRVFVLLLQAIYANVSFAEKNQVPPFYYNDLP